MTTVFVTVGIGFPAKVYRLFCVSCVAIVNFVKQDSKIRDVWYDAAKD